MPDVSDYHRVNAALLPVDSAPTTVLGRKTGLEGGSSGSTAVLFMKTDLRLKRSVESSPIGRATDRDRARKAPEVFTPTPTCPSRRLPDLGLLQIQFRIAIGPSVRKSKPNCGH